MTLFKPQGDMYLFNPIQKILYAASSSNRNFMHELILMTVKGCGNYGCVHKHSTHMHHNIRFLQGLNYFDILHDLFCVKRIFFLQNTQFLVLFNIDTKCFFYKLHDFILCKNTIFYKLHKIIATLHFTKKALGPPMKGYPQ